MTSVKHHKKWVRSHSKLEKKKPMAFRERTILESEFCDLYNLDPDCFPSSRHTFLTDNALWALKGTLSANALRPLRDAPQCRPFYFRDPVTSQHASLCHRTSRRVCHRTSCEGVWGGGWRLWQRNAPLGRFRSFSLCVPRCRDFQDRLNSVF